MKLAFVDMIPWDYDAGSPYQRPMGGSQSGVCYLSVELANRGHQVTICNSSKQPRSFRGVWTAPIGNLSREVFEDCGAAIVLNGPAQLSQVLRPQIPPGCKLVLWTGHLPDLGPLQALGQPEIRDLWDAVVCVSHWHREMMLRQYQLDAKRVHVCCNAIAPAFAGRVTDADTFARQKSAAPILAYTSTPFRGLDILLDVFERLHKRAAAARLRVYSSMGIYFAEEKDDPYRELYARCRSMSGAEYVGALPQPRLAEALKPAWILAYPNTFVETSCIAVMEAMACGMHVVTSGLGALPETTSGLGTLLPPLRGEEDRGRFVDGFVEGLASVIEEASRDPQKFWAGKWRQASAMRSQCTWAVRAAQWEQLLLGLLQAPGSPR
jgi:glycosyltransferase involved in cell wall biosynthesis